MLIYILSLISFLITYLFLKILIPIFSKNFLDSPNERSSHKIAIPTGGGISFVLVSTIACILFNFWMPLTCIPLSIIGFIDDRKSISSIKRYIVQIFTVIFLIMQSSLYKTLIRLDLNFSEEIVIFLFLIIVGTAIINFINFMDGLDGFLGLNLVIIFFAAILLGQLAIMPIVFGLIGFLIWNWSPAKIFMGDVGSTFLGAIYFAIIINFESTNDFFSMLVIGSPLLGDALICIVRRFFNRENIFVPHKSHLYQRLNQAGISHQNVSLIYASLTFITCLYIFVFKLAYLPVYIFLLILVYIYMDKFLAIPLKERRK